MTDAMLTNSTSEPKISIIREADIPLLIKSITKNLFEKDHNLVKKFNSKYWYWQYKQNPKKQSFIYVAWINKQIVGYYHVATYSFMANNTKQVIGNVQDVAVDEQFQGKGIFRKLAKFANSDINKYVDILYSFPNKKSINNFLKYDKFKLIDYMPIYFSPIKINFFFNKKKKLEKNNQVVVFNQLNEKIYEVFEKFSKTHSYYVLRDKDFLNWRYIDSPKGNFFFVGLITDNKITAVIVVKHDKIFKNDAFVILDFAFSNDVEDLKKLISNFHVILKDNYSLDANFVILSGLSNYMSEIKKCGYIKIPKLFIPRKLNLLVRLTDRNLKISNIDSSNWLVTLGDWDVF